MTMDRRRLLACRATVHIQDQLKKRGLLEVDAVEAAKWLDRAGILRDSLQRPGLPLRNLLRAGLIIGQRQESNHRWFIDIC